MCVAVYKPAGVSAPSMETLKSCWTHNPDGAGIGYSTSNGKFAIVKGMMKWKHFEKKLKELGDLTAAQVFFHFRIATHGSVRPGNCHPFPISSSLKMLQATSGVFDRALMHNGILPVKPVLKDTSDSQELARRLAAFKTDNQFKAALALLDGLEDLSRVAVWNHGEVKLFGDWTLLDGVYYSNMLWAGAPRYSYRYYNDFDDYPTNTWNSSKWRTNGNKGTTSLLGCGACDGPYDGAYDDDYDDINVINADEGINSKGDSTLHIRANPREEALIRNYGVCPDCENQIEEINITDTTAYCERCDTEWDGNFK